MRVYKLAFTVTVLIILGISCGFSGGSPNNNQIEPTRDEVSASPTATESATATVPAQDNPPPLTFGEILQSGIETGEWTEGEGLVEILQYITGETSGDKFPQIQEVVEKEFTGITWMAEDYLSQSEQDPEIVAELNRLLNIIFPPQEVLDAISRPRSAVPTNKLVSNQPIPLDEDQAACTDLANLGYLRFRNYLDSCYFFEEKVIGENIMRIYYPEWWAGDPGREEIINHTFDAMGDAVNIYSGFSELTIENVNIIFPILQYQDVAAATKKYNADVLDCPITVFPDATELLSVAGYKQVIAHEIFHCAQMETFSIPLSLSFSEYKWWMEGSAGYFSNLVYPEVDYEWGHLEGFEDRSHNTSLLDMAHESFPFFQFMGNTYSPEVLIDILSRLSAAGEKSAQASALNGVVGMDENFNKFVVEYLSSGILDSGGKRITATQEIFSGSEVVEEEGEFKFDLQPFVAHRFQVDYKQEKRFLQTAVDPDTAQFSNVEYSLRENIGSWSNLSPEIRSECEKDVRYWFVPTTIKDSNTTYSVDVTLAEQAECDPCLLGVWAVNNDSFEDYILRIMAESGEMPDLNGASIVLEIEGKNYLEFKEEGKINTRRDAYTIATGLSNTDNWITTMIDSQGTGTYSADGEELMVFGLTDYVNSITAQVGGVPISVSQNPGATTVNIFGQTSNVPGAGGAGISDGPQQASASYVCGDETLTVDQPDYGELLFDRVEAILPTPVPTPALIPNP